MRARERGNSPKEPRSGTRGWSFSQRERGAQRSINPITGVRELLAEERYDLVGATLPLPAYR
jgi:hypothetical protein